MTLIQFFNLLITITLRTIQKHIIRSLIEALRLLNLYCNSYVILQNKKSQATALRAHEILRFYAFHLYQRLIFHFQYFYCKFLDFLT